MRIAFSGAQNTGKSTLIDDFIKEWPMYEKADSSYRDKAKKNKNLKLNQEGNEESQVIVRDALIDQAQAYDRDSNVVFDRCIFDNLAYTLWLNGKGKVSDEFVEKQLPIIKESMGFYDIIFFLPILDKYPVEMVESDDGLRDMDPLFREEIDNIMKAIARNYFENDKRVFFPDRDAPALIEIFGSREERIEMIKLYVKEDGKCYGETESMLDPSSIVNPFNTPLEDIDDNLGGGPEIIMP